VDTDPAERWLRARLEAFMSERGLSETQGVKPL